MTAVETLDCLEHRFWELYKTSQFWTSEEPDPCYLGNDSFCQTRVINLLFDEILMDWHIFSLKKNKTKKKYIILTLVKINYIPQFSDHMI